MKKLISVLMSLLLVGSACAEEAAAINTGALLMDGLIVTAGGLLGVFLVLILFFFCIKLMQKIGK